MKVSCQTIHRRNHGCVVPCLQPRGCRGFLSPPRRHSRKLMRSPRALDRQNAFECSNTRGLGMDGLGERAPCRPHPNSCRRSSQAIWLASRPQGLGPTGDGGGAAPITSGVSPGMFTALRAGRPNRRRGFCSATVDGKTFSWASAWKAPRWGGQDQPLPHPARGNRFQGLHWSNIKGSAAWWPASSAYARAMLIDDAAPAQ